MFRRDSKFTTWLYVIARNRCRDEARARATRRREAPEDEIVDIPSELNEALAALDARDARNVVRTLMDDVLDETEKRVMTLHYGHDMRLDAITAALGLTNTSGAKAYIVSAKRKLTGRGEAMEDEILRAALAPSDDCLSVEQLGRYADGALGVRRDRPPPTRTFAAVSRCQAELALLLAVTSSGVRDRRSGSRARRRGPPGSTLPRSSPIARDHTAAGFVRTFPRAWQRFCWSGLPQAASIVLSHAGRPGASRAASRPATRSRVRCRSGCEDRSVTRSDVPRRFEWVAVDGAVRYRVRLMAVDRRGALVHFHVRARRGAAVASSSVDRSRQNAAVGRNGLRRCRTAHCRIGDAVLQGRAKVIRDIPCSAPHASHVSCKREVIRERTTCAGLASAVRRSKRNPGGGAGESLHSAK